VWRIFVGMVLVPIYRLIYMMRKSFSHVYRPAKNKLMLLLTNRLAVHVVIAAIVIVTGILNFQTDEVRAETFGEKSLLYSIITEQEGELIEEFAGEGAAIEFAALSYRDRTALTSFIRGIDFIGPEDISAISFIGGGTIVAPTISESDASIAPREGIELYVVEIGDTLSTIAEKFGISVNTLLWSNALSVRSVLRPGDEIQILPVSGVKHTVKSGDTLSSIAKKYDIEADEILEFNKLASADDLVIGEELIVPGGVVEAPRLVRRSTSITRVFGSPSIPTTSSDQPSVAGTGSLIWPTDLRRITQYYGWRHTGLDIDCGFNNTNYAADHGIVQYAGWKGGYGYAVEINHGNGIVTRYGHHSSLYVSAGQQVSRGEAIGRCGTTGRSTGTHLHFEVIVGGRYRNPLEYIR
ncbi:M23 family metallopeptidase, partial [Patescibacteria group bacterium]|nr:M23 family metallopeptidase [Patescibacteria group bacterium]